MLAKDSKEGNFDNSDGGPRVITGRRVDDQDQKHQASGSMAHAHVKKAKLMDTHVNRTLKVIIEMILSLGFRRGWFLFTNS